MRQEDLAKAMDIAPRQLQKYETGVNRITASRLVTCAQSLKVHVSWFYQSDWDASTMSTRLSEEESVLIERYRSLTSRSRRALLDIAVVLDREVAKTRRD